MKPSVIGSPNPLPCPTSLVMKHGSKARTSTSGFIPTPVSRTATRTDWPGTIWHAHSVSVAAVNALRDEAAPLLCAVKSRRSCCKSMTSVASSTSNSTCPSGLTIGETVMDP
jgi:hypothetical protein